MINYNKNKLINETLDKYYETFSHTLDTVDYVPEQYNRKICHYIFKNMKKSFRQIDKEDRKYQRHFKKEQKAKLKAKQQKEAKPTKVKFAFLKKLFRKSTNINADSNNNS